MTLTLGQSKTFSLSSEVSVLGSRLCVLRCRVLYLSYDGVWGRRVISRSSWLRDEGGWLRHFFSSVPLRGVPTLSCGFGALDGQESEWRVFFDPTVSFRFTPRRRHRTQSGKKKTKPPIHPVPLFHPVLQSDGWRIRSGYSGFYFYSDLSMVEPWLKGWPGRVKPLSGQPLFRGLLSSPFDTAGKQTI